MSTLLPEIFNEPSLCKWNFEELISMFCPEPLINCVVVFPTKKESALTSKTDGLVLNFREPLLATNSSPTPA